MTTPSPAQVARYVDDYADLQARLNSAPIDDPLPLTLLLAGGELLACSVVGDARAWAAHTLENREFDLPLAVFQALSAVQAEPSPATLSRLDQAVGRARKKLPDRYHALGDWLADAQVRIDLYRGLRGDRAAALRAAGHAWRRFTLASPGTSVAQRYATLVTAVELLDCAYVDTTGPTDARVPRRAQAALDVAAVARLHALDQAALDRSLSHEGETDAPSDEVAALGRPGLIVVPSLSHLPGGSSTGSTPGRTASTPRGEYGDLARRRIPLVPVPDLAAAAAELRQEFPGAEGIIDTVLRDCVGAPAARIRPTLIIGEPGAGKTRLARRLGEVLGLQVTVYGSGGVSDAAFGGTSRQWSTGRASIPLQAIKRAGRANPLVVLDEIEKAATSDHNGRLVDVLLPMLERETAQAVMDPYLECPVDLSAVSYVATANSTTGIPAPLLSRMRVLRMPRPPRSAVLTLAARIVADIRAEREVDPVWMPDLDQDELALITLHWNGRDLRKLRRLVETVLAGREDLTPRH